MAETDLHRILMNELIEVLQHRYADDENVYVSGNLLVFYEEGNKRRHLSPDCFVVFGVPKWIRPNYLTWEEGKCPDVVIELTSKSTKTEDTQKKFQLYQDVLKVSEYFLFDPEEEYLKPSMQGYRLKAGKYVPIKPVENRLPSKVLGLHLERVAKHLRLWDPKTSEWLPTVVELLELERGENVLELRLERDRAEAEAEKARIAEAEVRRLRKLLAKKSSSNGHKNGSNGHHE